jgi:hypothetical protein
VVVDDGESFVDGLDGLLVKGLPLEGLPVEEGLHEERLPVERLSMDKQSPVEGSPLERLPPVEGLPVDDDRQSPPFGGLHVGRLHVGGLHVDEPPVDGQSPSGGLHVDEPPVDDRQSPLDIHRPSADEQFAGSSACGPPSDSASPDSANGGECKNPVITNRRQDTSFL